MWLFGIVTSVQYYMLYAAEPASFANIGTTGLAKQGWNTQQELAENSATRTTRYWMDD
jgi:hypothetical protein